MGFWGNTLGFLQAVAGLVTGIPEVILRFLDAGFHDYTDVFDEIADKYAEIMFSHVDDFIEKLGSLIEETKDWMEDNLNYVLGIVIIIAVLAVLYFTGQLSPIIQYLEDFLKSLGGTVSKVINYLLECVTDVVNWVKEALGIDLQGMMKKAIKTASMITDVVVTGQTLFATYVFFAEGDIINGLAALISLTNENAKRVLKALHFEFITAIAEVAKKYTESMVKGMQTLRGQLNITKRFLGNVAELVGGELAEDLKSFANTIGKVFDSVFGEVESALYAIDVNTARITRNFRNPYQYIISQLSMSPDEERRALAWHRLLMAKAMLPSR